MKKILISVFFALFSFASYAQQDAAINQYFFNPLFYNPGYAGSKEVISAMMIYRNQWVGIDGAPVTSTISLQGPNRNKNMGFGVQVYNDVIGPLRTTGLILTYAYKIRVGNGKLSFGLSPSITQTGIDWNKVKTQDKIDPAFIQNDDIKIVPDADFGMYYNSKVYFAGFSMSHMIQNTLFSKGSAHAYTHMYFLAGGVIRAGEQVNLRPSLLIKQVEGAPMKAQMNLSVLFAERLWVGLGLNTSKKYKNSQMDNQIVALLECNITDKLRFGYSYDFDLQSLGKYNTGSHELMLGYNFSLYKSRMLVPRYF